MDVLTVHRRRSIAEFLTRAFALGVGTYLMLYALASLWNVTLEDIPGFPDARITFFQALAGSDGPIAWGEIGLAGAIAAGLAFPVAAALNFKVINRIAATLSVSRRIGDLDVWGYTWNSPDTDWVDVRDMENDIVYRGQVKAYSETGDAPQLLLVSVEAVRISTGETLYRPAGVYLSLPRGRVVIDLHGRSKEVRHG